MFFLCSPPSRPIRVHKHGLALGLGADKTFAVRCLSRLLGNRHDRFTHRIVHQIAPRARAEDRHRLSRRASALLCGMSVAAPLVAHARRLGARLASSYFSGPCFWKRSDLSCRSRAMSSTTVLRAISSSLISATVHSLARRGLATTLKITCWILSPKPRVRDSACAIARSAARAPPCVSASVLSSGGAARRSRGRRRPAGGRIARRPARPRKLIDLFKKIFFATSA